MLHNYVSLNHGERKRVKSNDSRSVHVLVCVHGCVYGCVYGCVCPLGIIVLCGCLCCRFVEDKAINFKEPDML